MSINNKYLEKISKLQSVEDYTRKLNSESIDTLNDLKAELIKVDRKKDPLLYNQAMSTGGHGVRWSIHGDKDGNTVTDSIKILHTDPNWRLRLKSPLYSLFQSRKTSDLMSAMGLRHEVLEAAEIRNRLFPTILRIIKEKSGEPIPSNVVITDDKDRVIGDHANLAVLMLESNLINSSPYKDRLSKLIKYRLKHESNILKNLTGKSYGDYFTEEDIAKGRHY